MQSHREKKTYSSGSYWNQSTEAVYSSLGPEVGLFWSFQVGVILDFQSKGMSHLEETNMFEI